MKPAPDTSPGALRDAETFAAGNRSGAGLLVLSEVYIPIRGGHVVWLHELCKRLAGAQVLTGQTDGLPTHQMIDGVNVTRLRLNRLAFVRPESLFLYGNFLRVALRLSRQVRPKAILAARVLPEGLIGSVVGRLLGIPSIVLAHGEEISGNAKGLALGRRRKWTTALKRSLLWRTYAAADAIIGNAHFTKRLLVEGGIEEAKVAVVHPGTDPVRFRPADRDAALTQQLALEGKRVILTLGRLTERKGQDMTIRALPRILQAVPECVYVIGGGGEYGRHLRGLAASLGLNSHVRFLGEVQDEMLPKLYALADVFAMPNRKLPLSNDLEGFGIVFLEAGACGVPVVGGRSGGVPDAVIDGQTGLLVDGANPDEIARAVIRLLTDRELARSLGLKARQRVQAELTWEHSARGVQAAIARAGH